jgi:predicted  nucleic acid-binding Zn-ribbon protein
MARRMLLSARGGRAVPWNQFFILQELDSQIDQLREELNLASLLTDGKTAHLDAEIARARRDQAKTQKQLEARERERAQTASIIPAQFLSHYERLRERAKSRPWVVRLGGPVCPACHVALPSQLASYAQWASEPVICPRCARLLIWRDVESKS